MIYLLFQGHGVSILGLFLLFLHIRVGGRGKQPMPKAFHAFGIHFKINVFESYDGWFYMSTLTQFRIIWARSLLIDVGRPTSNVTHSVAAQIKRTWKTHLLHSWHSLLLLLTYHCAAASFLESMFLGLQC